MYTNKRKKNRDYENFFQSFIFQLFKMKLAQQGKGELKKEGKKDRNEGEKEKRREKNLTKYALIGYIFQLRMFLDES